MSKGNRSNLLLDKNIKRKKTDIFIYDVEVIGDRNKSTQNKC